MYVRRRQFAQNSGYTVLREIIWNIGIILEMTWRSVIKCQIVIKTPQYPINSINKDLITNHYDNLVEVMGQKRKELVDRIRRNEVIGTWLVVECLRITLDYI